MAIALTNKATHSKSDRQKEEAEETLSDHDEQEEKNSVAKKVLSAEVRNFDTYQLRSLSLRVVNKVSITHLLIGNKEELARQMISLEYFLIAFPRNSHWRNEFRRSLCESFDNPFGKDETDTFEIWIALCRSDLPSHQILFSTDSSWPAKEKYFFLLLFWHLEDFNSFLSPS